jgi:hypothetical protein
MTSLILNLPYSVCGVFLAIFLLPKRVVFGTQPLHLAVYVTFCSFGIDFKKGWRGMTLGNVIILNQKELSNDLEHELVHVQQFSRFPLIFPFLYMHELWKNGYRENKYEDEAYKKAGNIYKQK